MLRRAGRYGWPAGLVEGQCGLQRGARSGRAAQFEVAAECLGPLLEPDQGRAQAAVGQDRRVQAAGDSRRSSSTPSMPAATSSSCRATSSSCCAASPVPAGKAAAPGAGFGRGDLADERALISDMPVIGSGARLACR